MDFAELDQQLQAAVTAGHVLGLSLAVVADGRVVFAEGYGRTAADETGVPVITETRFGYASISKTLCAALVLRLVEQGLLELDRPLLSYLPRLSFRHVEWGRQLTLRHVLSHTTGLPAAGRSFGPQGTGVLQQLIEAEMPRYAFLASPGTLHLYANTVYCLAGYAAEVVTGRFYDELLREWVLEPLAMTSVTFRPGEIPSGLLALPHEIEGDTLQPITRLPDNDAGHPSSFAYGTAGDLARLAIMHLEEGHVQGVPFLSAASLAEMHREHASRHVTGAAHPLAYLSQGYGLGLFVGDYGGHRVLRHGGVELSYNCFFELLPDERRGFVLLTNSSNEGPLMELLGALYDHVLGRLPLGLVPVPAPDLFPATSERQRWHLYTGLYLNVEWGGLAEVRQAADGLVLVHDEQELPLMPIGPGRYYAPTSSGSRLPVAFVDDTRPAQHLIIAGTPYQRHVRTAMGTGVGAFAGRYRDPFNLNEDDILHLRYEGGRLWLREGSDEEVACEPLGGLSFRCDLGFFELETEPESDRPVLVWGKATYYEWFGRESSPAQV